jgi:hypothetical protein
MENDSEQKGEKENESDIIVALCIAIADHKGSSADELSFKKKDIVKILQAPKEEKRKKQFYGELVQVNIVFLCVCALTSFNHKDC